MDMSRNAARELAVRLIYELGFTETDPDEVVSRYFTEDYLAGFRDEDELYCMCAGEGQQTYIRKLVTGVCGHGPEIDAYIRKYAIKWEFSRISHMALAVMRVAMYEILYMPDVPNASAIDAAVRLAKKYDSDQSSAFINGILGAFVRAEAGG